MNKSMIFTFFIALLTAFFLFADDAEDIIEKVQKTYDKMDNFSAAFKQIERFKITGSESETIGRIYVADGTKYRFESDDQIIVTDGKTIWTYNDISNQLLIDQVRENSGALLPRDLLFKYPKKYYATLLNEIKESGEKLYVLKLSPKEEEQGYVSAIKIWVEDDDWIIRKIETTDINGNSSTFELTEMDTKKELADSLFNFNIEEHMEVVDMR